MRVLFLSSIAYHVSQWQIGSLKMARYVYLWKEIYKYTKQEWYEASEETKFYCDWELFRCSVVSDAEFSSFSFCQVVSLTHGLLLQGLEYEATIEVWCDGLRVELLDPYNSRCRVRARVGQSDEDIEYPFPQDDMYYNEDSIFLQAVVSSDYSIIRYDVIMLMFLFCWHEKSWVIDVPLMWPAKPMRWRSSFARSLRNIKIQNGKQEFSWNF